MMMDKSIGKPDADIHGILHAYPVVTHDHYI